MDLLFLSAQGSGFTAAESVILKAVGVDTVGLQIAQSR